MTSDDKPGKFTGSPGPSSGNAPINAPVHAPVHVSGQPSGRAWGTRSIGSLLPAITRPAFRSRSAAGAQIMADWPAIVGPALAGSSVPRQLNRTTLTLACSGPVALELQHLAGQLVERINAHYGRTVVEQLRFIQAAAPILDPALARPRRVPPRPIDIPDMRESPLRDALASLGGAVEEAARPRPPKRVLTRTRLPEA